MELGGEPFQGTPGAAWSRPTLVLHAPEVRGQSISAAIPCRQQHEGTTTLQLRAHQHPPPQLHLLCQHRSNLSSTTASFPQLAGFRHARRFLQPHLRRPMTNESTSYTTAAHCSGQVFATQTPSSSALFLPPPKRTYFVTETFILGKYFNIVNKSIYLPHILNKFMLIVKQNCFYFNNGLQPLNWYCSQLIL